MQFLHVALSLKPVSENPGKLHGHVTQSLVCDVQNMTITLSCIAIAREITFRCKVGQVWALLQGVTVQNPARRFVKAKVRMEAQLVWKVAFCAQFAILQKLQLQSRANRRGSLLPDREI